MNIKITDQALRNFLNTPVKPEDLANHVSLCGPTFDKISKTTNDYIYDIEIITNRVDTACVYGIARESHAILSQMGLISKLLLNPYLEKINLYPHLPKTFHFDIKNVSLAPRIVAVSLEHVSIQDSPPDIQNLLTLSGTRPINNAVDITNELTLLYGFPSHIFDLDKLATQKLTVRESLPGETITTLDGQKNILEGGDVVIEDGAGRLVDLCGIMGGSIAEVDNHTKNILLMIPTIASNKVRQTSLSLQKRTLASQIFEKLPDSEISLPLLMRAIGLFEKRTGARVSSSVYNSAPQSLPEKVVTLDTNWANRVIGIDIPVTTITSILESLGFSVKTKAESKLTVSIPSWRYYDINIKEDLVEEIARVYGYSKLPKAIPCVNLPPETKNAILKTESDIKNCLSFQGFNEIYNHSLYSLKTLETCRLEPQKHLRLTNSLSSDYEYLRTTLVPSILQNLKNNQGKAEEPFLIFEIANIYQKTIQKLPSEISNLVTASTLDFPHSKGYLELLFSFLNLKKIMFHKSSESPPYFDPTNTAQIFANKTEIGFIGQIKSEILHQIGLNSNPTITELNLSLTTSSTTPNYSYEPISEFPNFVEEITLTSPRPIGEVIETIGSVSPLLKNITYLTTFQNHHTFRLTFSSLQKNLTQPEIDIIKEKIQKRFTALG